MEEKSSVNREDWLRNFEEAKEIFKQLMKTGLAAKDLAKPYKPGLYDMTLLERELAKICPDFLIHPKDADEYQMSKSFALDVLNKGGPASAMSKNWNKVRIVKLLSKPTGNAKEPKKHTSQVLVHMVKGKQAPYECFNPRATKDTLNLTIKQASLLALKKMEKLIEYAAAKGEYLLFPLTRSVFGTDVIDELYAELKEKFAVTYDIAHLLKILNQSAYEGGQNLEYSDLSVSAAETVANTSHLSNRALAEEIITLKVWRYLKAGKKVDIPLFELFTDYAKRGPKIPSEVPDDSPGKTENGEAVDGVADSSAKENVEPVEEAGADQQEGEAYEQEGEAYEQEGEAGKQEGEAGKQEGEAHKQEAGTDEQEGEAYEQEGEAYEQEGEADKQEGEAHKQEAGTDEQEGEANEQEEEADKQEGEAHKQEAGTDEQEGEANEQEEEADKQKGEVDKQEGEAAIKYVCIICNRCLSEDGNNIV